LIFAHLLPFDHCGHLKYITRDQTGQYLSGKVSHLLNKSCRGNPKNKVLPLNTLLISVPGIRFPRAASGASSALCACGVSLDTLLPQESHALHSNQQWRIYKSKQKPRKKLLNVFFRPHFCISKKLQSVRKK
jgi:hypothetical protein